MSKARTLANFISQALVDSDEVAANAITSDKILASAVTTSKLAAGAVTSAKIASGALDSAGLFAANVIDASLIADSSIGITQLAVLDGLEGQVLTTDGAGNLSFTLPAAGATGGDSDRAFWENDQSVRFDYSITAGQNAFTIGPITINDGVTVTVPDSSRWVVL